MDSPSVLADPPRSMGHPILRGIRARIISGVLLVLPVLITFWVIRWLYVTLDAYLIDPLAKLVIWKFRQGQPSAELPVWFESYVAPLFAVVLILGLLYCLGFFVHTRARHFVDAVLMRVPVISVVYNGIQNVFKTLDKQRGQSTNQRVVLVGFPHPGMKTLAFVTGSSRDVETQRVLLCVYVPTTPVPTSGYFLIVPEDEVTPINWSSEQSLQAIISGGLTAPPEVTYFNTKPTVSTSSTS